MFNVALETIVITNKEGGEKNTAVTHVILPFVYQSDADKFILTYDAHQKLSDFAKVYRTATKLY
ncbi:hypothetical protein KNT87_gp210 [Erwinia phage Cronus]|uniref:Uncharacterized protein n=1 Tax=Erwinia phage Cronus TaxID=2163633 RepID=A0A2S1GLV8_9CAUD|nr:hypothetical protein KNT87_gp210 [Erwinia phage Cronus]AWD90359.1 hypothetical protein [Erwinia phage Cronus]